MSGHADTTRLDQLLRPEAIAAARSQLGAPITSLGVGGWLITAFFATLFLCAMGFVGTAHYARKESVPGQVTPIDGALRIASSRGGIALQVLVQEGQTVHAGQELIAISSAPNLRDGDSLADALRLSLQEQVRAQDAQTGARLEQLRRQRDEISARRRGIGTDLAKLAEARNLQQARVQIQQQTVNAVHTLGQQGLMAAITIRARDDDLLATRQNLASLERESAQQRNLDEQLNAQTARLVAEEKIVQVDAAAANAQRNERRINSEASLADHLSSARDGVVTALQVREGAPVLPNQTLAVIVPQGRAGDTSALEVELWAPSRAIGRVHAGTKVRIMYDAFPFQGFGVGHGVVRDISRAPVMPSELPIPVDAREQLFRIRVTLERAALVAYGRSWPLSPGMRLSADLVLEERSLLDWLLAPLLAARKRAG